MIQKIINAFDALQFKDVWETRQIRFDYDLQEPKKPYQVYYGISTSVQDSKGNPGDKGNFFLTNLRIFWHSSIDRSVNFSIGIDTILTATTRSFPSPQQPNKLKHLLIIKSQNPSQTRYQFRFSTSKQSDIQLFQKVITCHKEALLTKFLRNIDTKVKLTKGQYIPLKQQTVKSRYDNITFVQNQRKCDIVLVLTDIRMIIIQKDNIGLNYGIPWILFVQIQKSTYEDHPALQFKFNGLLKNSQIYLFGQSSEFKKARTQIESYCQSYTKNPILGLDISQKIQNNIPKIEETVQEIEVTKINIKRNKNVYSVQESSAPLSRAQFNEELGIMIEKLPSGTTRKDLWQIIKQ